MECACIERYARLRWAESASHQMRRASAHLRDARLARDWREIGARLVRDLRASARRRARLARDWALSVQCAAGRVVCLRGGAALRCVAGLHRIISCMKVWNGDGLRCGAVRYVVGLRAPSIPSKPVVVA